MAKRSKPEAHTPACRSTRSHGPDLAAGVGDTPGDTPARVGGRAGAELGGRGRRGAEQTLQERANALSNAGSGDWLLDIQLAKQLKYTSVTEMRAALRRAGSIATENWVGGTRIYREPRGEMQLFGGKRSRLWTSFVAPLEQVTPGKKLERRSGTDVRTSFLWQKKLVDEFILDENLSTLQTLLAGDYDDLPNVHGEYPHVVLNWWNRVREKRKDIQWEPKEVRALLRVSEDLEGSPGAERLVTLPFEFLDGLARTLRRLNNPFTRPYYLLVKGRAFGEPAEKAAPVDVDGNRVEEAVADLSAAEYLERVAAGLQRFRVKMSSPPETHSMDSKLCRVNIQHWWETIDDSILLLLDAVAGELEGEDLQEACRALQSEWAGAEAAQPYEPRLLRHGVVLYAAEAMMVCRPDMYANAEGTGTMRPPLMRCLAQLVDNERVSGTHALTRQLLNQHPCPQRAWSTRRKINALLVKKLKEEEAAFIAVHRSDMLSGWMDNDDKRRGNAGYVAASNDTHTTAGAWTTDKRHKHLRFESVRVGTGKERWNLHDARKWANVSDEAKKAYTLDIDEAEPDCMKYRRLFKATMVDASLQNLAKAKDSRVPETVLGLPVLVQASEEYGDGVQEATQSVPLPQSKRKASIAADVGPYMDERNWMSPGVSPTPAARSGPWLLVLRRAGVSASGLLRFAILRK